MMTNQPIQETISYLLAQTCKAHRAMADRLLAETGLHVGQEMILLCLWYEDGLTQTELGERLCIQAATVTKMLTRMAQAGLVERQGDARDQRISRVYLTDKGRNAQEQVEAVWQHLEQCITASLSIEERLLLRRLLMQVYANIQSGAAVVCSHNERRGI